MQRSIKRNTWEQCKVINNVLAKNPKVSGWMCSNSLESFLTADYFKEAGLSGVTLGQQKMVLVQQPY